MTHNEEEKKAGPEGVTRLLHEWSRGDKNALDRVLPLVYDQLRMVARSNFNNERKGNPLQTTELVDMVYLKLARGAKGRADFKSRDQFFWYASQMMRHILVDQARARLSLRQGSGAIESLEGDVDFSNVQELDYPTLIALGTALERLEAVSPQQCRIIELRYFAGMTIDETARIMSVGPATVKREWASAKRWLFLELTRK